MTAFNDLCLCLTISADYQQTYIPAGNAAMLKLAEGPCVFASGKFLARM